MVAAVPPEQRKEQITANLAAFERIGLARPALKPAAVALCVVHRGGELGLVITRRARTPRAHAGQWALPGGGRDEGESAPGRRCGNCARKPAWIFRSARCWDCSTITSPGPAT